MKDNYIDSFLAQEFGKSQNYNEIKNGLFSEFNVKKGLRNEDGTGVRVGLTKVSDVVGYDIIDGVKTNVDGKLYYRGYSLNDIVDGSAKSTRGYEEVMFLLLFGFLPNKMELDNFSKVFRSMYTLPSNFFESVLLRNPGKNLMNVLQNAVLTLYNYDEEPDNVDVYSTLVKGIRISASLPVIMCYAYQAKRHYFNNDSLIIHYPDEKLSMAENILQMLRVDQKFSKNEAALLDTILILHADHGGGNNSTFTNVVVSSTGTDIYSTIAASIGSLKGPKHGGANISVVQMMKAIKDEIGITTDEKKIRNIVNRLLDKDFFNCSGLIYGFGHAVYTITDPRAELLREYCETVAKDKDRLDEYHFYEEFEKTVKKVVFERKGTTISSNVDLYSGFAYNMLGIPEDLYTPLFVISRNIGWVAHNVENKLYDGRIMRPATKYVGELKEYTPFKDR